MITLDLQPYSMGITFLTILPTIESIDDVRIISGEDVDITPTVLDEGSGGLVFSSGSLPDGLSIDPSTGQITGAPTALGIYNITIIATDSDGETHDVSFVLTTAKKTRGRQKFWIGGCGC